MSFDPDDARADAAALFELEMTSREEKLPGARRRRQTPAIRAATREPLECLSFNGANILRKRIEIFWAGLGLAVVTSVVPQGSAGDRLLYGVRSDLINGVPRLARNNSNESDDGNA